MYEYKRVAEYREENNMAEIKEMPKVALGAWAWGNDGTFGGTLTPETLKIGRAHV